jgi:hypothetical protein
MSAIDLAYSDDKKFREAIGGDEDMDKLDQLFGEAVDSSHSAFFTVNAKQSYTPNDWIRADLTFWKSNLPLRAPSPPRLSHRGSNERFGADAHPIRTIGSALSIDQNPCDRLSMQLDDAESQIGRMPDDFL